ncbi:Transcriptional regulator, ArsR family [uncultured Gammaproteobacteria bacterium]|uniref:ArsR/SmtB family transcription factor n=1 Tax=thiotrophic endosymbiont of Bathymodiolus puteoserpentis (Logatchev) TaxID=343240 RepID=UPI0010B918C6|nr:metalloregulator ArsR/SmtB family transcription factor [thiotrophic endosymbiont of Bathymodiolus puteoserpentis (Logatchev)]CAC9500855.1 Transcriptional regulator, ArsR family [uncultured Gammaproteobacteria bacterium]CAC9506856.1 Transcriptional regulator, ArsR family [uncultured Gammaproteobacteria bacterium]CAC9587592.1 Transcriptional regulator, ArsR family [uncultured Gammaproteobacteria bacterium]CAC9659890.1 Transcriptional regulator, ArsR family [uncultured Gammaproteobacteria bacte
MMKLLERDEDINKATKALKAMAHPLRLKILCVLKGDELPVLEIVEQVGSSQSNISQHIDILRTKGILESRRDGNKILCKIKDAKILKLVANMQAVFCSKND